MSTYFTIGPFKIRASGQHIFTTIITELLLVSTDVYANLDIIPVHRIINATLIFVAGEGLEPSTSGL